MPCLKLRYAFKIYIGYKIINIGYNSGYAVLYMYAKKKINELFPSNRKVFKCLNVSVYISTFFGKDTSMTDNIRKINM